MSIESLDVRPHDQQIVSLLLEGNDNRWIATQVGTTEQAVKNRLRSFYASAGIETGSKRVKLIQILSVGEQKKILPLLSQRESQIARLVLSGSSNREIALEMQTSVQNVKNFLSRVFLKCGVWSRTELAARFRCG